MFLKCSKEIKELDGMHILESKGGQGVMLEMVRILTEWNPKL